MFGETLLNDYSIVQICYMFDKKNYQNSLTNFKIQFNDSKNNVSPNIPEIIKDIV